MTKTALKWIIVLIGIIIISSCGYNPNFTIDGNCIVAPGETWFGNVDLEVLETGHHYIVDRNYELDGSNKVCFDQLPKAYSIISYSDSTAIRGINFSEGHTIKICRSGGCRAGVCKIFVFKSGELAVDKERFWYYKKR